MNNTPRYLVSILSALFVLLLLWMFSEGQHASFPAAAVCALAFTVLGIALVVVTVRQTAKGYLRLFLLLTGISAVGPLVGSVLHNMFYAFAVLTEQTVLHPVMEALHVSFFLTSVIVAPIVFVVGVVGSTVLFHKK